MNHQFDHQLNLRSNQMQQLFREGATFLQAGKPQEALARFQAALDLEPSNAILHLHAGAALHDLGRYAEAVASYRKALDTAPDIGETHNNLGNSLLALGRFAEAADCFSRAAAILTTSPVPLAARATALQALGNISAAEAECRKAILLDPAFAAAHWNLALNLLLQGRYEEGWQEYEWRWRKPDFTSPCRHTDIPLWDGSPLEGRTILLHAEQGFGDAIQFVRYAPLVAERGGTVIIECHPQLVPLFKRIEGAASVLAFGGEIPACAFQVPLLTLPSIFNTTLENIPVSLSFSVSIERLAKWQQLTSIYSGMKAGIVWAGSTVHPNDSFRSMPLTFLTSFAKLTNIHFLSLQIADVKQQLKQSLLVGRIIDLTDQIHDFADTAALIEQLDLVITIDTAVAHLAGALGKPVWLLLAFAPDWRWLLDRSDSPWYPTMQIFRQKQPGDWGEVITRVQSALETFSRSNKKIL
jgi:tetratricopeptide (TPR) repeat protein